MNKISLNMSEKSKNLLIEALLMDGDIIHKIMKTSEGFDFYVDLNEAELKAKLTSQTALTIAKKEAIVEISLLADSYHNQINGVSLSKLARYEEKAKAATAYKAGKASKTELALLEPEAKERKISLEAHCDAILAAKAQATTETGIIEALYAKAKISVKRARSLKRIEALSIQTPLQFQKAFEKWKNN